MTSITKSDIKFIEDNEKVIRQLIKIKEAQLKIKENKAQPILIPVDATQRMRLEKEQKADRGKTEDQIKKIVDQLSLEELNKYVSESDEDEDDDESDDGESFYNYNRYVLDDDSDYD